MKTKSLKLVALVVLYCLLSVQVSVVLIVSTRSYSEKPTLVQIQFVVCYEKKKCQDTVSLCYRKHLTIVRYLFINEV